MILPTRNVENDTEDMELVRNFVKGDESAFVEIIRRHQEKLFYVANDLIHNQADAEEIVQDTFVRAYRSLHKFRGDSSLSTWLHRITINLSRNRHWYFFRRRRQSSFSMNCPLSEDSEKTLADIIADENPTAEENLVQSEFLRIINECRQRLRTTHREILELLIDEHFTYEEIAQALCLDLGTVKSRVARARSVLQRLVEKEFSDIISK